MRRQRHEHYDSRLTQTSIDLFRLGKSMLAAGTPPNSTEFYEVSLRAPSCPRPATLDGGSLRLRTFYHGVVEISAPRRLWRRRRASSPAGGGSARQADATVGAGYDRDLSFKPAHGVLHRLMMSLNVGLAFLSSSMHLLVSTNEKGRLR